MSQIGKKVCLLLHEKMNLVGRLIFFLIFLFN